MDKCVVKVGNFRKFGKFMLERPLGERLPRLFKLVGGNGALF